MKPLRINTTDAGSIFVNPACIELVRLARDNSGHTAIFLAGDENPIMTAVDPYRVTRAWSMALNQDDVGYGEYCVEAN